MSKFSIISLLCSILFFITGFCITYFSNYLFITSIIFSILSFILLFTKFKNIQYFIYILMVILFLFKGELLEGSLILLIGGIFYNIISIIFGLDEYKFKISLLDIISIIILIVGFFIPVSYYYVILTFLLFYSTVPIVYSLYLSVILKDLEKNNIQVNSLDKFEKLASIKNVVFTKTGVLTLGEFEINRVVSRNEELLWKYITYAEATRKDRIAELIMSKTTYDKVDLKKREKYKNFYNGISYTIGKKDILVGNSSFLAEYDILIEEEVLAGTVIYVVENKKVLGYMVLTDKMRLSTKEVISNLRKLGVDHFSIFSNDQERLNTVVSRTLNIHNSYGNLTPQSKDFWLYYMKEQHGKDMILITDDHVDFDVKVKINLQPSSFKNKDKSDIMILDKDLKKSVYIYELSVLLKKWKKALWFMMAFGKIVLLIISLIFISEVWLVVLCNFIWMLIEMVLGCNELLK